MHERALLPFFLKGPTNMAVASPLLRTNIRTDFKLTYVDTANNASSQRMLKQPQLPPCNVFDSKYLESGFIDSHCHHDFLLQRQGFKGSYAEYQKRYKGTFPNSYQGCIAVFCNPFSFNKLYYRPPIQLGATLLGRQRRQSTPKTMFTNRVNIQFAEETFCGCSFSDCRGAWNIYLSSVPAWRMPSFYFS
ncbi:deoxyribonuclease TATDN2 [Trichonephila clavipes]|nr:deoxyribonuclease TATDN2 [Trichonephila clavipes]